MGDIIFNKKIKTSKIFLISLILITSTLIIFQSTPVYAATGFVADGRLTEIEKQGYIFFSINWSTNTGSFVEGGLLGIATDEESGNHFLYYQLPVDYKDNTWSNETVSETPWGDDGHQVGEYNTNPHTVRKIWQGDQLGGTGSGSRIVIRPTGAVDVSSSGAFEFNVDLSLIHI